MITILITVIILIIKLLIYYSSRNYYWHFSHFLFFPFSDIRETQSNHKTFIKIVNNLLTLSMGLVLCLGPLFVYSGQSEDEVIFTDTIIGVTTDQSLEIAKAAPLNTIRPLDEEPKIKDSTIKKRNKAIRKVKNKVKATKRKQEEHVKKWAFTLEEMYIVLNMINEKREMTGSKSNCVQIVKTKNSNITNAFDVAKFLQRNGFVIAGREVKSIAVKGFAIEVQGIIFKVIVGDLNL